MDIFTLKFDGKFFNKYPQQKKIVNPIRLSWVVSDPRYFQMSVFSGGGCVYH